MQPPKNEAIADSDPLPLESLLIVTAAPVETRAVLAGLERHPTDGLPHPQPRCLETGIGKANAAAAVARELALHPCITAVINIGIAGTLAEHKAAVGALIASTSSVFADEGVATPDGFLTTTDIGFPLLDGRDEILATPRLMSLSEHCVDHTGRIATVSTCSGTTDAARAVRERTGAIAEAMEGAAVGLAAVRAGAAFIEVRAISNTTGDRSAQRWDIPTAAARIERWCAEAILGLFPTQ
ncbi:MAG: futalosine hydrolase [Planctomycetota bacterium]